MATQTIKVPDIGGAAAVDVIEVMVKPGDVIAKDDPIITLESEKASMEVPTPQAGKVASIKVKVGDKVSEGDVILELSTDEGAAKSAAAPQEAEGATSAKAPPTEAKQPPAKEAQKAEKAPPPQEEEGREEKQAAKPHEPEAEHAEVHAGPGVRRYARELGVELQQVIGTGHKGRIVVEDIQHFVKGVLAQAEGRAGLTPGAAPLIDFSRFGPIDTKPLGKLKRLTGQNTQRSWTTVPHVTQFDSADITELEDFRKAHKDKFAEKGVKLTLLVFLMKAVAACLKEFPFFNTSLAANGEELIFKKYIHLGVAVDTPNGLVVPVIRDVDQKGLSDLAEELARLSHKAREKGLSIPEMQGGCFTISSLGGIGGTAFTPIVNAPEVAILGVSRASMQPVYRDDNFVPRLLLPLSLSYDHRVIDGAEAARFSTHLVKLLSDVGQLLF